MECPAKQHFVNFLYPSHKLPNAVQFMNNNRKVLALSEICRLRLGFNRDAASVISSVSKMKAYHSKFYSKCCPAPNKSW